MRKRWSERIKDHKALILTVVASLAAAVAVGIVFFIGHVKGWFGTSVPTATDWLTATGTALLAFAAPVSIWLVGRQIASAQKTAEDERHFAITPSIVIEILRTRENEPRVLPPSTPGAKRWRLAEGAIEYAAVLRVRAVGNGAANSVVATFLPIFPMRIVDYLKVTNYPPTVEPPELPHLLPDTPQDITVTWVYPMEANNDDAWAIFGLRFLFTNALGRTFSQAFWLNVYKDFKSVQIGEVGSLQPAPNATFEDYVPLIKALQDMAKATSDAAK
jgi:hypothetical protein